MVGVRSEKTRDQMLSNSQGRSVKEEKVNKEEKVKKARRRRQ